MLFNRLLNPLRQRPPLLPSKFLAYQHLRFFAAKPPVQGPVHQASLMQRYMTMTSNQEIKEDKNQQLVIEWLHAYTQNLYNHEHDLNTYKHELNQLSGSSYSSNSQPSPEAIQKL